jgi:hypothetical protein
MAYNALNQRIMKLAHLILVHAHPLQVQRLVKRLLSNRSDIYIHLDKKADRAAFIHLADMPGVFFIENNVSVGWGDYSMVQATLNAFEEILAKDIIYSHINLLSGQDYPLKSIAQIEDLLFASPGKTFMQWLDIKNDWSHGRVRLANYSFGEYHFPARYRIQSIANKLLPKRKMPENLVAYGKSQWLTITPACAGYAIDYIKNHTALARYFKLTWGVDEVFFQTILVNSPLANTLVNDNLRLIEMDAVFRPRVFGIADADELMDSGKLFARKFDGLADTAIFDYLDRAANETA